MVLLLYIRPLHGSCFSTRCTSSPVALVVVVVVVVVVVFVGRCRGSAWWCRRLPTRQCHHQENVIKTSTSASSDVLSGYRRSLFNADVCSSV